MDIDHRQGQLRLAGANQPIHQRLQSVGLIDNDLGIFLERRILQLHFQQLGRTAQATQRILDFMRQVAEGIFINFNLVKQPFVAFSQRVLFKFTNFYQH